MCVYDEIVIRQGKIGFRVLQNKDIVLKKLLELKGRRNDHVHRGTGVNVCVDS